MRTAEDIVEIMERMLTKALMLETLKSWEEEIKDDTYRKTISNLAEKGMLKINE